MFLLPPLPLSEEAIPFPRDLSPEASGAGPAPPSPPSGLCGIAQYSKQVMCYGQVQAAYLLSLAGLQAPGGQLALFGLLRLLLLKKSECVLGSEGRGERDKRWPLEVHAGGQTGSWGQSENCSDIQAETVLLRARGHRTV